MFKRAQRSQSKLRLAIIGPSGSGKTYSALLLAMGLGGEIALMDTERGSGSLYSDLCNYDIAEVEPPYSPDKYIAVIKMAEKSGYTSLIIDSLSHAWAGEGGILEFVDKAAAAQKNNFAAWREASPIHNKLVDTIIGANLHIICTMRSKTVWDIQKDERSGKTKPVKIGLAPVQRDGLEYEFTTVLELSVDGHIASASKDRTSLFDNKYFVPTAKTGEALKTWLEGGTPDMKPDSEPEKKPEPECEGPSRVRFPEYPKITEAQVKMINTLSSKLGLDREAKIQRVNAWLSRYNGRTVESTKELTKSEASSLIEAMQARANGNQEDA